MERTDPTPSANGISDVDKANVGGDQNPPQDYRDDVRDQPRDNDVRSDKPNSGEMPPGDTQRSEQNSSVAPLTPSDRVSTGLPSDTIVGGEDQTVMEGETEVLDNGMYCGRDADGKIRMLPMPPASEFAEVAGELAGGTAGHLTPAALIAIGGPVAATAVLVDMGTVGHSYATATSGAISTAVGMTVQKTVTEFVRAIENQDINNYNNDVWRANRTPPRIPHPTLRRR